MLKAKDFPHATVEIECAHCARYGRYSKARFCEIVGEETDLPTALAIISDDCPENMPTADNVTGLCRPMYLRLR